MKENLEQFEWRTETYEYVDDPIAIDLLFGCSEMCERLEAGVSSKSIQEEMELDLGPFLENEQRVYYINTSVIALGTFSI